MSDGNLSIEYVPINQIGPHPDNPRQGDVGAIWDSIQVNGVYRPLIVQTSSNRILAGNHTYAAMRESGLEMVPVVFRDVDDVTARRIMLADNRTADLGDYDPQALLDLLQGLPDLGGTGYDGDDLDQLMEATPDFDPDPSGGEARLDRKSVTDCPNCGHTFEPTTRSVIDDG